MSASSTVLILDADRTWFDIDLFRTMCSDNLTAVIANAGPFDPDMMPLCVYPDARKFLDWTRVPLVLCSSFAKTNEPFQRAKLKATGMWKRFRHHLLSCDKAEALRRLDFPQARRIVFVDDSLEELDSVHRLHPHIECVRMNRPQLKLPGSWPVEVRSFDDSFFRQFAA